MRTRSTYNICETALESNLGPKKGGHTLAARQLKLHKNIADVQNLKPYIIKSLSKHTEPITGQPCSFKKSSSRSSVVGNDKQ
jgi:hypothetical protein